MSNAMIIVPNCSGQMCNKLIYFVHAIATAIDCKRDLVYLFGSDVHDFSDLHVEALGGTNVRCCNWHRSKIVDGICGLLENWCHPDRNRYAAESQQRISRFKTRPRFFPIILWDWFFRNYNGVLRHRTEIVSYLRAKDGFVIRARNIIAQAREGVDLVIGLHIRRGDYKEAFGGRYYFSDAEYLRFMQEASRSFNRPIRFVIVSNEPVNCAYFLSYGVSAIDASASAPEDVATLSECDCIMGPASTFSRFAAYYGNKPLCRIDERTQQIVLADFKLVEKL